MMDGVDCSNPGYARHRVSSLNALLLSLILGTLGIVLVLAVLGTWTVASASKNGDALNISIYAPPDFTAASATTTTVYVTKTVEPDDPDTGGIVSICFTITGLEPRKIDVVLAQDVSGSMDEPAGEGVTQTRLEASQAAARAFVNSLPDTDRAAVVPYSDTVYVNRVLPLTTTKSSVLGAIDDLIAGGNTNIGEGIKVSHEELITSPRYVSDTVKTIILLSDGKANRPVDENTAKEYAREQAEAAARDDVKIYSIGFGGDADGEFLQEIANIGGGQYFFAPDGSALETIYLAIALELHNVVVADILVSGVELDCARWPEGWCVEGPGGVTTVTLPISDTLLISGSATICFTATVNLDPNYEGPINLPGSGICYLSSNGEPICEEFDNPPVTVGGRKITGDVFHDLNANGLREEGEWGVPGVGVQTSTGLTTVAGAGGNYVLRTSDAPPMSVAIQVPQGWVTTTPVSENIPSVTGIYTVNFGIHREIYIIYLPAVTRNYPPVYPVYLPVVARDYSPPDLINGGFENGWTGWTHGGELPRTITSANPHSGNFSALLGNPGYKCENGVPVGSAWIQQTFLVPHTAAPRLSFWYNIWTQDKNPYRTYGFDIFDVKINDTVVLTDARITGTYGCNLPVAQQDLGWRVKEVSLDQYRGQRITIRFRNLSYPDGWFNTWTYVDDVRFMP